MVGDITPVKGFCLMGLLELKPPAVVEKLLSYMFKEHILIFLNFMLSLIPWIDFGVMVSYKGSCYTIGGQ